MGRIVQQQDARPASGRSGCESRSIHQWPCRLLARTPASHAGKAGSIPARVTISRRSSTAERPRDMRVAGRSNRPAGTRRAVVKQQVQALPARPDNSPQRMQSCTGCRPHLNAPDPKPSCVSRSGRIAMRPSPASTAAIAVCKTFGNPCTTKNWLECGKATASCRLQTAMVPARRRAAILPTMFRSASDDLW